MANYWFTVNQVGLVSNNKLCLKTNLSHFTWVAVNEKAFGSGQLGKHALSQEIEDNKERHQLSLLHHFVQLLSPLGAGLDLVTEEISRRQVGEAILGHDPVALGALSTAWSTQDPNNGQFGIGQRTLVNRLAFKGLERIKKTI